MPNVLDVKVINNTSSVSVKKTINFHKEKTITQRWENSDRFLIGVELKVGMSVEVPGIASVSSELTVKSEYEKTFTFGKELTTTTSVDSGFEMECQACRICTIKLMMK